MLFLKQSHQKNFLNFFSKEERKDSIGNIYNFIKLKNLNNFSFNYLKSPKIKHFFNSIQINDYNYNQINLMFYEKLLKRDKFIIKNLFFLND
jgi:hypothetical protein